jgi:hypothetical protein
MQSSNLEEADQAVWEKALRSPEHNAKLAEGPNLPRVAERIWVADDHYSSEVVERTFAWLNQFHRVRVRYDKRADIHAAFLSLGCALTCWHALRKTWATE